MAESARFRRFRVHENLTVNSPPPSPSHETIRCKSSISSMLFSTFAPNPSSSSPPVRKKGFSSATLRGLGCASPTDVSSPAAIRSQADWQGKRSRKKKQRKKKQAAASPAVVVPDVWCSPGTAYASDAASVDCVVSRRPNSGRGRGDGETSQGERPCIIRRRNNALEQISSMDSPFFPETQQPGPELLPAGYFPHLRGFRRPPGLAEIVMLQSGYILSGPDVSDHFRDWRLDVDNMSYEELLELGDRIGHVSTGLREEQILRCLRRTKHSFLDALPPHFSSGLEWKCSICQEEYEDEDEVGKLECDHCYHLSCIKQWLLQKNACPVCKVAAAAQK